MSKVETFRPNMSQLDSTNEYIFTEYFKPVGEPLFELKTRIRKFSFQKLIHKFDKISFYPNQIRLINEKSNIISEIIPIQNIKQIYLKYRFLIGGKQIRINHRLDLVIEKRNEFENKKNICISEILPPFRQLLKETGESIEKIFLDTYKIPVKVNKPFFF